MTDINEIPDDILYEAESIHINYTIPDPAEVRRAIAQAILAERNRSAALSRPIDPKAEVEPVAWRWRFEADGGLWSFGDIDPNKLNFFGDRPEFIEPLYRSASPSIVAPGAVPEGWQLVPKEPTEEMYQRAYPAFGSSRSNFRQMYRDMLAAAPALTPAEKAGVGDGLRCYVGEMGLSDGRTDYYVTIDCGGRQITPHMYRIKGRAEYDVAEWNWLFFGGEKPFVLDFDTEDRALSTTKPAQSPFAPDGSWDTRVSDGREEPKQGEIEAAAKFLVDRLKEFERKIDDFDDEREFQGHVVPAIARLSAALAAQGDEAQEER